MNQTSRTASSLAAVTALAMTAGLAACQNADDTRSQKVATGEYVEVRESRSIDFLIRVPSEFAEDTTIWNDAYEIIETTDEMFVGVAPG